MILTTFKKSCSVTFRHQLKFHQQADLQLLLIMLLNYLGQAGTESRINNMYFNTISYRVKSEIDAKSRANWIWRWRQLEMVNYIIASHICNPDSWQTVALTAQRQQQRQQQ